MKPTAAISVGVVVCLLRAGAASAITDDQYRAIGGLGELNGIALHCRYLDQTRRMKRALVEVLPRRRALGQGFDDATNESFLRFIAEKSDCPDKAAFDQRVGEALRVLERAFGRSINEQ
ncbi:MAG TPA: hypothetical protein ENI96_10555 [Sedimenticola thiotaurini]|uniref:Rap1a immunity protein domain-containing protein n=1 Tax=Sedimenticola thiotaurini TaxID=1543721 RepID=A0A831RPQ2_9GAMM|nr:hypothetical protein [Sedimenticola thiotaurini]